MKRSNSSAKSDTTSSSSSSTQATSTGATRSLPQHVQERNRSIAEREALRLARPERPQGESLGHANRNKSAVSSTPFGFDTFKRNVDNDENDTRQYSPDDWCGPFSVARQMISRREEARRNREEEQREREEEEGVNGEGNAGIHHPLDEMVQQALYEKKRKANPSMTWKPSLKKNERGEEDGKIDNLYKKRQKRLEKQKQNNRYYSQNKVPSLFQKCVDYIVDNFENVESLGGPFIDNSIRRAICEALVSKGKMNGAAFDTLAEEGIETLEIIDCTAVTSDQMAETLNLLIPAGLRALILNHAGRCFTSKAVQSIVDKSNSANGNDKTMVQLFALSIAGAYLLKDADVAKLIAVTAPTLSSIHFKACPLIGLEFCNALGMHYSSSSSAQTACLLELVLEDLPSLSKKNLMNLASNSDALKHLKSLSLRQIDAIDDEVVHAILSSITGGNLEGIDLSLNVHLTDQSLSSIRRYNENGQLKSLSLSGIQNLGAAGLEAFFTFDLPGLPNPPTLRTLDLSSCHYESVNESVINLAISASALKRQPNMISNRGNGNIIMENSDVSTMGGLVSLDVSGGSVTDRNMENLASKCHHSLKELKINFCSNISDNGLGYLVSKVDHQFNRLELWGCAQITETFLDGHSRVEEGGLEILGVWMSKGCRTSKK